VTVPHFQNNVRLRLNTREDYKHIHGERNGLCGGTAEESTAVNELYKVSDSVNFLSEGRITQQPTAVAGQIVTEKNITSV
jgi:hypothetical protein